MNDINQAVAILKSGALVAFPTETVYGLGADASNPEAVKKIFLAKGRPADHPVIIHIHNFSQITQWAKSIPDVAHQLAKHFWPGPMTLIFPAAKHVPAIITGGQDSIGIRMPAHPMARELLKVFGSAIAAPSANRFGRISATTADHVSKELGNKVNYILDDGACSLGLESTIIDLTHQPPRLLRPGPLTLEQIEKITGVKVCENKTNALRVSGNLASHYAPVTPMTLMNLAQISQEVEKNTHIAVMSFQACHAVCYQEKKNLYCVKNPKIYWQQVPNDAKAYAHDLYALLRALDELKFEKLLVEIPPHDINWQAIHDRLNRAASK